MKTFKSIALTTLVIVLYLVVMSLLYWGHKVTSIDFPGIVLATAIGYHATRFSEWLNDKFNK